MNLKKIYRIVTILIVVFSLLMNPGVSSAQDPQPQEDSESTLAPENPVIWWVIPSPIKAS